MCCAADGRPEGEPSRHTSLTLSRFFRHDFTDSSFSVRRSTVSELLMPTLRVGQQAMEVVHAGDRLSVERNDDVAFPQSGSLGGTARRDRHNDDAGFLRQIVETHHAAMQRHGLRLHADVAAADTPIAQQSSGDEFRGVDADGEAQCLARP